MKYKLGIDIDGVLAEFNNGFAKVLRETAGRDLLPKDCSNPPVWDWPQHYGYSKEEVSTAWAEVSRGGTFWNDLGVVKGSESFCQDLPACPDDEVYFITARMGLNVKLQTEDWLEFHQLAHNPTVLIAYDKGPLAKSLRLTHFIDDKAGNCSDVLVSSPETHVFLLDRNYNRPEQAGLRILAAKDKATFQVITDVSEFIDALQRSGCPA
jgi:uncharacterized HAD superfamily protein